jgi:hypothetical protein
MLVNGHFYYPVRHIPSRGLRPPGKSASRIPNVGCQYKVTVPLLEESSVELEYILTQLNYFRTSFLSKISNGVRAGQLEVALLGFAHFPHAKNFEIASLHLSPQLQDSPRL